MAKIDTLMTKDELSSLEWLRQFEEIHGRPLRVLHVGNIANNAYLNAKIMRRIGIHADHICPDYYHAMGCPEWEDSDYEGDVGDHYEPQWGGVDLKGFRRPDWFVQGPRNYVTQYLIAVNRGEVFKKIFYSIVLNYELRKRIKINAISIRIKLFMVPIVPLALSLVLESGKYVTHTSRKIRINFYSQLKLIQTYLRLKKRNGKPYLRVILTLIGNMLRICYKTFRKSASYALGPRKEYMAPGSEFFEKYPSVFESYPSETLDYKILYEHYDFVIGYATEGVYPLLAGIKNFASYEHGTIREIPFEDTELGKLCALTYQNSPVVFITNTDCVAAADKLGIERARQYWIPHAIDTNKIFSLYDEMRSKVSVAGAPHVFLSPARQHWEVDDSGLGKGNDRVIHAAKILSDEGLDFKVQFVEWGQHVSASKELIAELCIEEKFDWVSIMRKRELRVAFMSASAVIDQFVFPALGGITFEALALGRPVISYLDTKQVTEFFGEMPPLHNCNTADGIAAAMRSVICDAEKTDALGRAAQDWVRKYHSSERVLDIEITAIRKTLSCHKESSPD